MLKYITFAVQLISFAAAINHRHSSDHDESGHDENELHTVINIPNEDCPSKGGSGVCVDISQNINVTDNGT